MALAISSTTHTTWTGTGAGTTGSIVVPAGGFLVASVNSDDAFGSPGDITFTVTGGSLSWMLAKRVNAQPGTAELWTAYNAAGSTMTVSAQGAGLGNSSTAAYGNNTSVGHELQVTVFTGAETSWGGASGAAHNSTGVPSATVTTTRAGSYVIGVTSDYSNATAPTPVAGLTVTNSNPLAVHYTGACVRTTAVVAGAGTVQTVAYSAPSPQSWNLAAIEIRVAPVTVTGDVPGLTVEAGFGSGALNASPVWTDVTQWVRSFAWARGRQHELAKFEPGHGQLVLVNNDRRFDPTNTASPYWPNLVPNVRFRITATYGSTSAVRVMGFAQVWDPQWPDGTHSDTHVELADILSILAQVDIPEGMWAVTIPTIAPGALQAWWRLSEATGATTAIDQTGRFNAVYATPAVSIAGLVGSDSDTAQSFAGGGNDYVIVPDPAVGALTDFTVYCLFSITTVAAAGCTIVGQLPGGDGDANNGLFRLVMLSTGQLQLTVDNSKVTGPNTLTTSQVVITSAASFNNGATHIVEIRKSGTAVGLWVDDAITPVGTAALTLTGGRVGGEIYIGFGVQGVVDEVVVFNTPTSAAQHIQIFASANPSVNGGGGAPRLPVILAYVGVDPAESVIDGDVYTSVDLDQGYAPAGKALALVQDLASFSQGLLFANAAGVIVSHGRQWAMAPPANQSQGTFSDSVTSTLPYRPVMSAPLDIRDVSNSIAGSRSGGLSYRAVDAASVALYGPRDLSGFTDLPLATDLQLVDLLNYLVTRYRAPMNRVAAITMLGNAAPATLYPQLLAREIGDRVTVIRHPPGGGPAWQTDQQIEGISETYDAANRQWLTTWSLAPADSTLYLVLDDPTSGVLGVGALAF